MSGDPIGNPSDNKTVRQRKMKRRIGQAPGPRSEEGGPPPMTSFFVIWIPASGIGTEAALLAFETRERSK